MFFLFHENDQPLLVSELLPDQIIPGLYQAVETKLERVVDLGPFKHKVRYRGGGGGGGGGRKRCARVKCACFDNDGKS